MKIKIISLLCLAVLCLSLVSCGDNEVKRPMDYPDSKWVCESAGIEFSVSQDCKIVDATMVDKNGERIEISLVFSETSEGKVSITNVDGSEAYVAGTCSYEKDKFTVTVTDVYNPDIEITSARLVFERS